MIKYHDVEKYIVCLCVPCVSHATEQMKSLMPWDLETNTAVIYNKFPASLSTFLEGQTGEIKLNWYLADLNKQYVATLQKSFTVRFVSKETFSKAPEKYTVEEENTL